MSIILIFIMITLTIYFIKIKYKLFLIGCRLAGPVALPLLGNVQMISKLKPEYLFVSVTESRKKYHRSYRLWLGPSLWVFLHSPKETRDALNDSSLIRADTFHQLEALIGNGLLLSEGKYWEAHRRALGPAFHPNVLNSFAPVIFEQADTLIEKITKNVQNSMEATEYLFPCILDIIMATSMGAFINAQNDPLSIYTNTFHSASELLFKRMVNPLLAFNFIFKRTKMFQKLQDSINTIHALIASVIQERIRSAFKTDQFCSKEQRTLLNILLTTEINGRPLTFQEIHDEVNTFLFAGVDTTTAAMSFMLYALAKYPAEQRRIFEEIQNLSISKDDNPTLVQLNSLVYLDMFIKEALRYFTIVPLTGRQTTKTTKIGDIEYCAGITLWINIYGLTHDEELFDEPHEFQPLRFAEKNHIEPFSYLPFSGGPHVCIGRKYSILIIKIITVKLIQNFEIFLKNSNENLILMAQMVLKSLNGINSQFKLRD